MYRKITMQDLRTCESKGMTQAEAARALGVERATISYHARKARERGEPFNFRDGRARMEGREIRVTLPTDLLAKLDAYTANSVERVRSRVVTLAVREFLRERGVW